jgi:hypothetical protein
MPSTSKKQKVAMAIACHDPKKSTSGIPQDVACEFNRADASKRKRAKAKVKEAVEYLETLKMIESVRSMSFTHFLVEDASKKAAPDALTLISNIRQEAQQAVDAGKPGAMSFWQRLKNALSEPKEEHRLMGAIRARDAYHAMMGESISFEESEAILEAVVIPADASHEKLKSMMDAAKKAMSILAKIKNVEYRAKRHKEITSNMNKIRAALKKKTPVAAVESLVKELDALCEQYNKEEQILEEKRKAKPSAGLSKKQKSATVKKAEAGKNIFGGGFKKIEKKAEKEYGSKKAGKKVAASIMWKKKAKNARKVSENVDFTSVEVDYIVESIMEYQHMMKKLNKVFEKHLQANDFDNKNAIIKIAMEHGASKVEGFALLTEDEQLTLIKDTCQKYELCEQGFGDEMDDMEPDHSPDMGGDMDQQPAAPAMDAKANFKLSPEEIGKVAELVAHFVDFPPTGDQNRGVTSIVDQLQYADLFHLTPQEVIKARKLLASAPQEMDATGV